MKICYFWDGTQVLVTNRQEIPFNLTDYYNLYCVDVLYHESDRRYGKFTPTWKYVPFEDFPKEFKASLLLLGVS